MVSLLISLQRMLLSFRAFDFLAPLAIRIYLVPVFWVAGTNKLNDFSGIVEWFTYMQLPYPPVMASLVIASEIGGAVLLALGLATRWVAIPLMITMAVAAFKVHWDNGWQAVHDLTAPWASTSAPAVIESLNKFEQKAYNMQSYKTLMEHGNLAVINNGIEWAATYFIMLLALFFIGAGKYFSFDYYIKQRYMPKD
ncbi:DoxX family protein [Thiomicrorhabdus sp. 6S2-11]|uniref:DoxX family protein n=1 Tax=Thiomicrorhabdus marina TaxID=2818442 RepID=A0ABS3Q1V3_9GAMM|nr:DoxX family protein [Thiomicrorhabdus marina]MBO1926271.1 DoxX family protein [Thiomicrorhabdus marina]